MPPKKLNNTKNGIKKTTSEIITEKGKNSIKNMFERIKSKDNAFKECSNCNENIKSCQYDDHLKSKCKIIKTSFSGASNCENDDDIILIDCDNELGIKKESNSSFKKEIIEIEANNDNIKEEDDDLNKHPIKRYKSEIIQTKTEIVENFNEDSDEKLLNNFLDNTDISSLPSRNCTPVKNKEKSNNTSIHSEDSNLSFSQYNPDFDYYLKNFTNAIESVLEQETFSCLLDDFDRDIIKKFSTLKSKCKVLYVRLFQRKFKWHNIEKINYDKISNNLSNLLDELLSEQFLIDEESIDSYDEVLYQFKLPQLKELAKMCHVTNIGQVTSRADIVKALLQHFKTQKSLKQHFFSLNKTKAIPNEDIKKSQFMMNCKKLLGKCYKLNKIVRDVFVRILTLYSLSSANHIEPNKKDSGQQQLFQILMVNLGKVKFMNYDIKLDIKIFEDREALIRYQQSIDEEIELFNLIDSKDYDIAFEKYNLIIAEFKSNILDKNLNEYNSKLPIYLRQFTSSSVYCRILSLYAFEVLQKLRKYAEANELFDFLIFKQNLYLQTSRPKWFERMALNYETHLKNPLKSFEILQIGLKDTQYVKRAGRLALHQRLVKMTETKRYQKIKELKECLNSVSLVDKFEFEEAPTIEIEGTILHSEYIPGRKNIFIQNFESSSKSTQQDIVQQDENDSNSNDTLFSSSSSSQLLSQTQRTSNVIVKNRYHISVETVALQHYINNLDFEFGKHAETSILTTLFGLLFWNIVFDNSVYNVFIDKFQSCPLDLQTEYFYSNRKQLIDERLDLFNNSPIDFICEIITECWTNYFGIECSLVSWSLFESLEELLSLVKCFSSIQLTNLCRFMSQNFRYCRSGGPDLIVWSATKNRCKFVEVKGPGDRLSYKQMMWLDFMIKNSIECEVCYVKGTNSKRLRGD